MPTRVLDVGSSLGSTKLVQTRAHKLREPYLALSYCWGQGTLHATNLNDSNVSSFLEFIDEKSLTMAHRECITIARQLGIRYVWIDALCIIQGNLDDWDYESNRMAQTYGNAMLTVIAGRAADSRTGFVVNHLKQKAPPCAVSLAKDMGDIFFCLPRATTEGPTSTRAWCFQEKMLSRRTLLYAAEQVYFSCQEKERWENDTSRLADSSLVQIRSFPKPPEDIDKAELDQLRAQMLSIWYKKILPSYTIRQLTQQADVFAAISSIAQLAQNSIRSRYLAGLWEADIACGLLWGTAYSQEEPPSHPASKYKRPTGPKPKRPTDKDGNPVIRAPSWSWASINGQVDMRTINERHTYPAQIPSNVLIRPLHYHAPLTPRSPAPPRWTPLMCPPGHADVLRMPSCELVFLANPKRVRCSVLSPSDLANLPKPVWQPWRYDLADQGFLVALRPTPADNAFLHGLDPCL